jgi:hypothetical protein
MHQRRSIVAAITSGVGGSHWPPKDRWPVTISWSGQSRRACALAAAMALFPFLNGCYNYKRSVTTAIDPGTEVSLTITDQGRVSLGERFGRGVLRVNGRLVNPADTAWVVQVSSVETITGGKSHWSGEEVRLPRAYVGDVATREFSRQKTWLAVGVAVGAVVVAIAAGSLIGGGVEGTDVKEPPDGQTSRSPVQTPASTAHP